MEQQCKCAYCSQPLSNKEMIVYGGKMYHHECGERVKARRSNPATYRMLDEVRNMVECLYSKDDIILNNADKLGRIHAEVSSLVSVP